MTKGKTIGAGIVLAIAVSLLIPVGVSLASASAPSGGTPEFTVGTTPPPAPPQPPPSGCGSSTPTDSVSPGLGRTSELCCADGTHGHWQWGGTNDQNLFYCEAPPTDPPATAPESTDSPAVSPASAAPKKAAAAKPTFTG